MTASFYSIAKACIWQSKYKTNSTNNNLEKFSYITNNESRIFMQEETNFITNLFTWCSFEFIISFMLSGDDFLSKSGIIRLIWLINACLCTEYLLHWKRKWISSSTWFELHKGHNLFSLGKWSIWYRPCSIISLWLLILNFGCGTSGGLRAGTECTREVCLGLLDLVGRDVLLALVCWRLLH